ncbi:MULTISPECIES: hypothetical protein [Actinomyces]|uniref:Uncharacterized protein n=2 Tax=Actinomyces TaxID=1654 RepID=A0A1M4RZ66_9ACTO|nr:MULTISPECIES: hypothetical protein [Actinomyces]CED91420.1 Hypothetical protein AAM4_1588 [Actinomyces succiniciruminis]SHE25200.1 Hypothetical protein ACGLYG10_1416 [Actinomyces glycerinitolerans]
MGKAIISVLGNLLTAWFNPTATSSSETSASSSPDCWDIVADKLTYPMIDGETDRERAARWGRQRLSDLGIAAELTARAAMTAPTSELRERAWFARAALLDALAAAGGDLVGDGPVRLPASPPPSSPPSAASPAAASPVRMCSDERSTR